MNPLVPTRVVARANIALIKYWGKADTERNVPAVGSLSLTLDGLETETSITPAAQRSYLLDDRPMREHEAARIAALARDVGIPDSVGFRFASKNRFPTAAGLASSASGGAAAALALWAATGRDWDRDAIIAAALRLSGSAPRSLYGGFVSLRPDAERGARIVPHAWPSGWDLAVLVATTAVGRKDTSSRDAMMRSLASPYYRPWVETHPADLDAAEAALAAGNMEALFARMEANTMKMHALVLASEPPVWYWTPVTLAVLAAVREGKAAGLCGGFTMDAGPHVKLFVPAELVDPWRERLAAVPGVREVLVARPGSAPQVWRDGEPLAW